MKKIKAPPFLQKRFARMHGLAWGYLYPDTQKKQILRSIELKRDKAEMLQVMKGRVSELATLLFLFGVYTFFKSGADAAKETIKTCNELNVDGFALGGVTFEGNNSNVMLGEVLADAMLKSIKDKKLIAIIKESNRMYQVAEAYQRL